MTEPNTNPYESPLSASAAAAELNQMEGSQRPKSPMVIGVIGLIIGGLGLIGGVIGLVTLLVMQGGEPQPGMPTTGVGIAYTWIASFLGILASALVLAAGVFLVRYKRRGVGLFNGYAWLSILLTIAGAIYSYFMFSTILDQMAAQDPNIAQDENLRAVMSGSMMVGIVFNLLWLIYPILGMVLLNRQEVKQSLT